MARVQILTGDVRESLRRLPDNHVHCVVTSPPYWALRSYLAKEHDLKALELGSEPTPEAYVENMVGVFREVRRVLRDDGLCFVDIGDSYANAGIPGGASPVGNRRQRPDDSARRKDMGGNLAPGLKSGDLCMIPARLALALQADGWYLRQIIVWAKPCPMPESLSGTRWERCRVKMAPGRYGKHAPLGCIETNPPADFKDATRLAAWSPCPGCAKCDPHGGYVLRRGSWRCTTAHEYVLMMAKSPQYFADQEAVKEPFADNRMGNPEAYKWSYGGDADLASGETVRGYGGTSRRLQTEGWNADGRATGRNPRSVWTIGPEPNSCLYCGACGFYHDGRLPESWKPKLAKKECPKCGHVGRLCSHYAAFPSELPERCINVATSAKGCCPACGAPWARIVETTTLRRERPNELTKRTGADGTGNYCANTVAGVESRTLGWKPTCDCPAHEPVPCRVMDPFLGSGTTAIQAVRMGRDVIGCELNPDYVAMARNRMERELGLLADITEVPASA